jgi:hypothetical protein
MENKPHIKKKKFTNVKDSIALSKGFMDKY